MAKDKGIVGVDYPDSLYPEACTIAEAAKNFSVLNLQRLLNIGYNRAYRLIDKMVFEGKAAKSRESLGRYEFIGNK